MNTIKLKQLAAVAALAALPCAASAAISIGNAGQNQDVDAAGATNTISNFVVVEGSHRKLVLTINAETEALLTGITFGAQPFTKAVDTRTSRLSQIWYLDDATIGTSDIVATFSANARSLMGVVSLTGVTAGGPSAFAKDTLFRDDDDATKASIDLTTTEANTFVIGGYTQQNGGSNPINPSAMTELYRNDSGSSNSVAGYQIQTISGLSTYTWEAPSSFDLTTNNGVAIASFTAVPVPEPGSYALLAGVAGLCFAMLRRRR